MLSKDSVTIHWLLAKVATNKQTNMVAKGRKATFLAHKGKS